MTCVYRSKPSTHECRKDLHLLIKVTWSRTFLGHGLSVAIDESHATSAASSADNSTSFIQHPPLVLREKKGNRPYSCPADASAANIWLFWDVSSAKYPTSCPEPVAGFYVIVVVDGECALQLGDEYEYLHHSSPSRSPSHSPFSSPRTAATAASVSLVSRREKVVMGVGRHYLYSTKARFRDDGMDHEISIRCKATADDRDASTASAGGRDSELAVCIDKKKAFLVRRLGWNFRGNQTIFIDGFPVDLMWDVHDWWFRANPTDSPAAVFLFRTRSALESRLWLEEDMLRKSDHGRGAGPNTGFSLLIQAFKASPSS